VLAGVEEAAEAREERGVLLVRVVLFVAESRLDEGKREALIYFCRQKNL
jgi:hypothetical protein